MDNYIKILFKHKTCREYKHRNISYNARKGKERLKKGNYERYEKLGQRSKLNYQWLK